MRITPKLLSRRTALLLPLLATPAQAQAQAPAQAQDRPLKVVASFTILADMVQQIGESRVTVRSLAGPNQDLHGFEPRPSDLQAVAAADVMVVNGLGLEGWAERIAKAAGFKGTAIVASRGVAALKSGHKHGAGQGHAGHNHGAFDPHAWQDIANARIYVENIRAGLAAADPARAASTTAAAARYTAELTALDAEIRTLLATIPRERRRAVTSHDAFAYFADAYAIDMLAIAGTWRDSEPSARDLATLTAQVKRQNIRALFLENAANPAALRALSSETGIRIGGQLYPDALTPPGGPADTYIKMMRHNATIITEALK
jgi:zinc/manganese transport system substrate-binding protein